MASCLPPPAEPFNIEVELDPLPRMLIEDTLEDTCSVSTRGPKRIEMGCPGGVTYELRQTQGTALDFGAFPDVLQIRAFHRSNAHGGRADLFTVRDQSAELLLAYAHANGLVSALDPGWAETLDPFTVELAESDCEDPIYDPCPTCRSRALHVSTVDADETMLHGTRLQLGPWTLETPMLASCETCEAGFYPEIKIAIIHESVLK